MSETPPLMALALRMIRASDVCEQGHRLGSANPHVHADVVHGYGRTLLDAVRTDVVRSTPMTETPLTEASEKLLADTAILGRFPDDVNGIPGRGNLQWLRQHLRAIEAAARAEAADEVARLTADLVAATDPASCQWCGHHQSWHMCSGLGCDCRRAALAQPAPDATACAECGHPCDATYCGCVAACKAHQS